MRSDRNLNISVVIPTYNSVKRLEATIRSVLAQERKAHEIIVVDDGSSDRTPDVATLFGDAIRYFRVENGGQQRARNIGVAHCTGNWIALLDHDDLWDAGYLREVADLVESSGVDLTLCNSRTRLERPSGNVDVDPNRFTVFAPPDYWKGVGVTTGERWSILERYDLASYIRFHPSQTSMVTLSRALYEKLGGFDERMRGNGAENFEFELRALRVAKVGLIWTPLVTMVRHDSNASLDGARMTMDVVDCLNFALATHDLSEAEREVVRKELPPQLEAAISGAFSLGKYRAVLEYARQCSGSLPLKTRVKIAVASLPAPFGHVVGRVGEAVSRMVQAAERRKA